MEKKSKLCIVAVGYNRPKAMKRLLDSIICAEYKNKEVDLFISIDKGELQNEIIKIANECEWNFGEKIIKVYSERQGLRKHIIQCGDLTELYKAVVILEDDISVSPFFFEYVLQAVQFYGEDENIAGISLYKHEINVGCSCFFEPDYNGYDTFLMQFAQSWGQCWTYRMWKDFKQWYIKNELNVFEEKNSDLMKNIPSNIKNWGNQSWLKYYMVYLVEKDLYFVYPYHALSTNHSEVGQHNFYTNSDYQISLSSGEKEYKFPRVKEAVKYDIYFERVNYKVPKYENKRIIFDLYGKKRDFSKGELLLSSQNLPYKVIDSWALNYHPQEVNCKYQEKGVGIFLYDLSKNAKKPKSNINIVRTRYDVKAIHWKKLLSLGLFELKDAVLRKVRR